MIIELIQFVFHMIGIAILSLFICGVLNIFSRAKVNHQQFYSAYQTQHGLQEQIPDHVQIEPQQQKKPKQIPFNY